MFIELNTDSEIDLFTKVWGAWVADPGSFRLFSKANALWRKMTAYQQNILIDRLWPQIRPVLRLFNGKVVALDASKKP
jgi:hypothetical protein